MNNFNRCKVTGVRWLKKPVENIQIQVQLKPQDGILSLPKFEDYTNESNSLSIQQLENKIEDYTFKWQEKVFSLWELQRYSDIHNCISETELTYHDMIENLDYVPSKIFTYIHTDYHLPLPELKNNKETSNLNSCFGKLSLNESVRALEDSSSTGRLFRSSEDLVNNEDQWIAMHVVFDHSEYNEDSQLLLKQQSILLSLYYNAGHNFLIVSPDMNSLESNPYPMVTETGVPCGYLYAVGLEYEEASGGEELVALLQKLEKKWERQQRQLLSFQMPSLGRKLYYVTLELLSASDFDAGSLYVEFNVKIPDGIQCNDTLNGRTHVASSILTHKRKEWNFGHLIELTLEMETSSESPPIKLFFEVISKDWWGRHRTEGYSYLPLTLQPGYLTKQLSCSRPEELDAVEAESRRFFVGGCHLIKDLEVLAKPQLYDTNYKFTTTGTITIRSSIISQAALPGSGVPKTDLHGSSSASALLLGAEAVLRQYRKARARLAAATEGLAKGDSGS